MINSDKRTVRSSDLSTRISQTLKGLRRRDLVHEMTVNVEQRVALSGAHDVVVEYLVVESSRAGSGSRHGGWGGCVSGFW